MHFCAYILWGLGLSDDISQSHVFHSYTAPHIVHCHIYCHVLARSVFNVNVQS